MPAPHAASSGYDNTQGHAGHRYARLSQILHEELVALLRDEVTDPALDDVRVTSVELSVDYRSARVRFVPASLADDPSGARVGRAFERAAPFLRARLTEALEVKNAPALRFVFDRDAAAADHATAALAPAPPSPGAREREPAPDPDDDDDDVEGAS